jgi:hypothetical protein
MLMPTPKLTNEIIIAAITGFESQKRRIDDQIGALRALLPGGRTEPVAKPEAPSGKRRKMSAAARKRIGDAQRKRWAASKGTSQPATPSEAPKHKRKLSAAGKRAIAEATKKRWAAFHAAKKTAAKKVAAKAPVKVAAKKTTAKKPQKRVASAPVPAAAIAAQ